MDLFWGISLHQFKVSYLNFLLIVILKILLSMLHKSIWFVGIIVFLVHSWDTFESIGFYELLNAVMKSKRLIKVVDGISCDTAFIVASFINQMETD